LINDSAGAKNVVASRSEREYGGISRLNVQRSTLEVVTGNNSILPCREGSASRFPDQITFHVQLLVCGFDSVARNAKVARKRAGGGETLVLADYAT
jgi:hypothetical protein